MKSIGFGLERLAWPALAWPRTALAVLVALAAISVFGVTRSTFDEDLRNVFNGNSAAFADYTRVTEDFVDPENETLVLIEGRNLGQPEVFTKLQDFQFELQLAEGVDSVFSLFSLREPPADDSPPPPLVADASAGLSPDLAARIRSHPILGQKLLSADGTAMLIFVTPQESKAPLAVSRQLKTEIEAAAGEILSDSGLTVTVTGFPAIRVGIVDVLRRDQRVLNATGALVGFVMSLIVFRSFVAALMTAVPAIFGGLVVIGFMGVLGIPVTVLSNVVPALVMIVGYADGMHLTHAWRVRRDLGATPAEAARLSQEEIAAACMLTAITTSIAFLSLTISQVDIVRSFGWTGAAAMLAGGVIVLAAHAVVASLIGGFWRQKKTSALDLLDAVSGPSAAVSRFAVNHARKVSMVFVALFATFFSMYLALPPEHSIREHLPPNEPANAALGRIDENFGGAFPIQVVVPLEGLAPTSPAAIEKIGAVHRALAAVDGVELPLSLWSLVEWIGGGTDAETERRLLRLADEMAPSTRSRFFGDADAALVSATVHETPTHLMEPLIERIESAVKAAGGDRVIVTGVTVVTTREGTRTISNLNVSLTFAVFADLFVMIVAFRNWSIGLLAVLSNTLPILTTCAVLYLLGRGMQFNTVIALTVAFGIAVDDTTHYLNRFLLQRDARKSVGARLIDTSRHIGPVLVGTTLIVTAGLSTTLASGMPTVRLFGGLTAATLVVALVTDLLILPALIAGPARRWFEKQHDARTASGDVPA